MSESNRDPASCVTDVYSPDSCVGLSMTSMLLWERETNESTQFYSKTNVSDLLIVEVVMQMVFTFLKPYIPAAVLSPVQSGHSDRLIAAETHILLTHITHACITQSHITFLWMSFLIYYWAHSGYCGKCSHVYCTVCWRGVKTLYIKWSQTTFYKAKCWTTFDFG